MILQAERETCDITLTETPKTYYSFTGELEQTYHYSVYDILQCSNFLDHLIKLHDCVDINILRKGIIPSLF